MTMTWNHRNRSSLSLVGALLPWIRSLLAAALLGNLLGRMLQGSPLLEASGWSISSSPLSVSDIHFEPDLANPALAGAVHLTLRRSEAFLPRDVAVQFPLVSSRQYSCQATGQDGSWMCSLPGVRVADLAGIRVSVR